MKNFIITLSFIAAAIFVGVPAQAGNPDRIGEAGATHLLINPWARSSGWAGAYTAGVSGLEALRFNPAGLVSGDNSEMIFSRTNWFQGAGIYINSFGLKARVGSSALGFSIMSTDMGDFVRTTTDLPDGTLGTFSPSYTNIGISYAYQFSTKTRGGVTMRMISESIPDVSAFGVALDAGIQYRSSDERFKLGFALRNVGPAMRYSGTGLDFRAIDDDDANATAKTVQSRVAPFELPSILNIGVAYDLFNEDSLNNSQVTLAGNFVAMSFGSDRFQVGAEYNYKDMLFVRAGLSYERNIFNFENAKNASMGPTAGATFNVPLGKGSDRYFGIDYAYRRSHINVGDVHTIGVILSF